MKTTSKWHVLYVRSRWEKKVHERIQEAGVESFLPIVKKVKTWSDRKKVVEEPLFKSYVFVNITSPMDFYKALSVNGASAYVHFGRDYAVVRDCEIEQIKQLLESNEILEIKTATELPEVGEYRKIICGALSGLECEVIRAKSSNKILVRLESIKQNLIATIPSHYLEQITLTA